MKTNLTRCIVVVAVKHRHSESTLFVDVFQVWSSLKAFHMEGNCMFS